MKNNKLYDNIWNQINKLCNVNKDFDKDINVIMLESDDKINGKIMIDTMTIVIKSVFKDGACYFPQIILNYCFTVNYKCLNTIELMLAKELIVLKIN